MLLVLKQKLKGQILTSYLVNIKQALFEILIARYLMNISFQDAHNDHCAHGKMCKFNVEEAIEYKPLSFHCVQKVHVSVQ